jgi:hypothetical protein
MNIADYILIFLIFTAVAAALAYIIRKKKSGACTGCGGNCSSCGKIHGLNETNINKK